MTEQLTCEKHGDQNEAFVCTHLVLTLKDKVARGLIWSRDEEGSINAYCAACDDLVTGQGGEWNDDLQQQAGIVAACEACILPVFDLNGTERPA